MAKDIENSSGEDSASALPPAAKAKGETSELPSVESPSISPCNETLATPEPAIEPIAPGLAMVPANDAPGASRFGFKLNERHKRHAMLAATVVFAACIGAVIGALAVGSPTPTPKITAQTSAALHERAAMQKSIVHLNKEIATLKANIVAANKAAHSQIAKNTDRITEKLNDHAERAADPETTGSIPTPLPRPVAAAAPMRPPVIGDWAIRDAHNGYVYVQGHGDIYQVVPGANLPGLGPVQSITRQDGRWVVLTPRGVIVSMRDRRFFE
jgi:hypothetical protein